MLFKQQHLHGIKNGTVSFAFRKWKTARVKKGSLIKTSIGQVLIEDIQEININAITEKEALLAGHSSLKECQIILDKITQGSIFKITVKYHSEDPRIALREDDELSETQLTALTDKLNKMDARSNNGAWTVTILSYISEHPALRAQDMADNLGYEKDWLKPQIRKLKDLGLTISLGVGYKLSPRGISLLNFIRSRETSL